MENNVYSSPPTPIEIDNSTSKNILIVVLIVIILIFTSLGTFATDFVSEVLYSTGWFIGKTSDVVATSGETTLDVANSAIHHGSDLMIKASRKTGSDKPTSLNDTPKEETPEQETPEQGEETSENKTSDEPSPDTSTNPIQKPISSGKTNWCLVGEYQGRRGCIEVNENDKCMSGQIFPSQYTCLNPNFSQNVFPNMTTPMGVPPRMDLNQLSPYNPRFEEQQRAQEQISNPNASF
jgi:hypothetical protein